MKGIFVKIITLAYLAFLTVSVTESHIHMMVDKLFNELCTQDSKQTISLYECQPKIIQHDKKANTFRNNHQYRMETFYMMTKYDGNRDKRLSKQETLAMAYDISHGNVNERVVRIFWQDYGPKNNQETQAQKEKETTQNPQKQEL